MSEDAAPGKKLYYATAVSAGEMTLEELCEDIAESSTVTSADVKAVLDRLGWVLSKNLKAGRIVQVGELGNFRMTLGSSGTPTIEEFNAIKESNGDCYISCTDTGFTTLGTLMSDGIIAKLKGEDDGQGDTVYWPISTVTIDNVDEAIASVS